MCLLSDRLAQLFHLQSSPCGWHLFCSLHIVILHTFSPHIGGFNIVKHVLAGHYPTHVDIVQITVSSSEIYRTLHSDFIMLKCTCTVLCTALCNARWVLGDPVFPFDGLLLSFHHSSVIRLSHFFSLWWMCYCSMWLTLAVCIVYRMLCKCAETSHF